MKNSAERIRAWSAVVFVMAAGTLTASTLAGHTKQCTGYCSTFAAVTCKSPDMQCCCGTAPVYSCVCRLPTDCNKANGCQDP